jgi:hypothetical protein
MLKAASSFLADITCEVKSDGERTESKRVSDPN